MSFVPNALKIVQDVKKEIARDNRNMQRALTSGMRKITEGAKKDLRNEIKAAGLGGKLANTWRGNTYPKGENSFGPAGYIYSQAPHIIHAFERGPTVTAKNSKYLAIPTQYAMRRVGRKRLTPRVWEQSGFPPLRFIPTAKGGLLVIDGFRSKSKKTFRTGNSFRGGNRETLVMFILVRSVKHKKRLDSESIAFDWYSRYPTIVDELMVSYG